MKVIGFLKPKKPKWNILISDLSAPTARAGALVFIAYLFLPRQSDFNIIPTKIDITLSTAHISYGLSIGGYMSNTQLLLLAINCINENREPSHTELSKIYVFYRTEIDYKNISINEFMLNQNWLLTDEHNTQKVMSFIEAYLHLSSKKAKDRKQYVEQNSW